LKLKRNKKEEKRLENYNKNIYWLKLKKKKRKF